MQRADGPHVLVDPVDIEDNVAVVRGPEAHHLVGVLRTRRGDPVSVTDGSGALWQGRAVEVDRSVVILALGQRWDVPRPRPSLTVVHGLPKGRKLDAVVRDLSEVGVDRLVPVVTARSEVRPVGDKADKVVERWRAVAHAAAKQSRRVRPLVVEAIAEWPGATGAGAVLWEEATTPLGVVLTGLGDADEIVVHVGAEGGLTADEVAAAAGAPALLGETILRTETAALVAASVVLHRFGRLG